jgi:orotidine-5'-phosphate decarboxylase
MNMFRRTGLILALDIPYETPALQLLTDVHAYIDAVKIGYQLLLSESLSVIKVIKREFPQLPVIADLKIMDAPHIASNMTFLALDAGADVVTVCGICGPTVLQECLQLTVHHDRKLLVFLEFTQLDGLIGEKQSNQLALLAKKKGVWGILAPGTKPHRIMELRRLIGESLIIISCGIGAQGTKPGTAIKAGADFEIVGREICAAPNSKVAAANIRDSLSAIIKGED